MNNNFYTYLNQGKINYIINDGMEIVEKRPIIKLTKLQDIFKKYIYIYFYGTRLYMN